MRVATTKKYIEILNFRHFFNHFVFTNEGNKIRNKQLKKYINVSVVIDLTRFNKIFILGTILYDKNILIHYLLIYNL
ncbi:hypothetical protein CPJCM30710_18040 [Clostridium polyendosporum]|uniref:Uncharacterized protein n=1 Tax=Clostridium polyendosporum TaxID=69208 RepID=A0A919S207_9CLOT|nr:hypothetical protein CPJCM30710_18040 [Clostridium polyendosporum]